MDNYGDPMAGHLANSHVTGTPPSLGTPVPGTTGGLAAKPGLSVMQNPMAQALQSRGRGEDSMLVHMTPGEVGGLQNLAMAHGGSLTINPHTGLPEAGFLSNILPTLLGVGLSFIPGVGPLMAAGLTGIGTTAVTGDISKGLMAGLGAFGGASLAGALAPGAVGEAAGEAAKTAATAGAGAASNILPGDMLAEQLAGQTAKTAATAAPTVATQTAKTGLPGVLQRFGQTASQGLGSGMLAKYAPYAAGYGLLNSVSAAMQPTLAAPEEQKSTYEGPYQAQPRKIMPRESGPGGEIQFFDNVNPYPGFLTKEGNIPKGYAEGGETTATPAKPALADYVGMFQTSPGAITAQHGYGGNAPSDQIRAAAKGSSKENDYGFMKSTKGSVSPVAPYAGSGGGFGDISSILSQLGAMGGSGGGGMSGTDLAAAYGNLISPQGTPASTPSWSPVILGNGQELTLKGPAPAPFDFTFGGAFSDLVGGSDSGEKDKYPQGVSLGLGTPTDVGLGLQGFGPLGSSPSMTDPYAGLAGDDQAEQTGDAGGGGGSRYSTPEDKSAVKKAAKGGEVGMDNGSFVVDARTVSELGNGSSNAGIERLIRLGGRPVRGDGDGVSDSVPARIGGKQEARVARDEVIFSPQAVAKVGGGDHKRGTQKLYALMEKAHKARKQAKRGQDTGVAKGLGALR